MYLSRLKIRHFRNLGIQDLRFPSEGAAILGENAQGKSNLLEAIYYLETFRSFRGARDDQLLAFGEDVFRVAGTLESSEAPDGAPSADCGGSGDGESGMEVAAAFQGRGRKKKVTVGGVESERIGDALGRLAAVVFSPSDVEIVTGGPGERRRFLDIVLSLNASGYLEALQRFRQILSQRNAALREEQPPEAVRVWDDGLVRSGARVVSERGRWISEWAGAFSDYYRSVSGGAAARMEYRPDIALEEAEAAVDEATVAEAYCRALAGSAERERRQGYTVVGPHRDEVAFAVCEGGDGLDVRDFGSGGQRRTTALALRLVEADTVRRAREQEPVILLDDVFAELDEGRGRRILELIEEEEPGQVILTAPKESDVRLRRDVLPRWRIENGKVTQ